jgi:hypothetical protein
MSSQWAKDSVVAKVFKTNLQISLWICRLVGIQLCSVEARRHPKQVKGVIRTQYSQSGSMPEWESMPSFEPDQ